MEYYFLNEKKIIIIFSTFFHGYNDNRTISGCLKTPQIFSFIAPVFTTTEPNPFVFLSNLILFPHHTLGLFHLLSVPPVTGCRYLALAKIYVAEIDVVRGNGCLGRSMNILVKLNRTGMYSCSAIGC